MWVIVATKLRSLMITLMPLVLKLSVITAYVLDPGMLRLVSRASLDAKVSVLPLVIHISVFEFAVVQVQVTVSPGHADGRSQVTAVASKTPIIISS